jgi:hypothetical protein
LKVKITEMSPGALVRDGTNLMKVTGIYRDHYATAKVVLVGKRIPRLPRIKHYSAKDVERLQQPTEDQIEAYRAQAL